MTTIANIARCKIITKLNICKAFNKIKIAGDNKEILTIYTLLRNLKPTVLDFGPCNRLATF